MHNLLTDERISQEISNGWEPVKIRACQAIARLVIHRLARFSVVGCEQILERATKKDHPLGWSRSPNKNLRRL